MLRKLHNLASTFLQSFFLRENKLSSSQKWVLGLLNLAAVVVFWVSSSFLVNELFESNIYRKPFFITYINTSCFAFFLIPYFTYEKLSVRDFVSTLFKEWRGEKYYRLQGEGDESHTLENEYGSSPENQPAEPSNPTEDEVPILETTKLSLQFIVLWFTANLVTNSSLSYTSVASQTILSSTSSFFTLLIGYFYLIENINANKIAGILLLFAGVLIVTKVDASNSYQNNEPTSNALILWGNLLALAGALVYGVYTILLKYRIMDKNTKKERNLNTHLFFGCVGLYCLIFLWPIILVLHFTGVEQFELPKSGHILLLLGGNALITFVSDFCWCKAVLLTSPLTVTVGLSLTIPLAMVGDWIIKNFEINLWYLTGAIMVTVGFMVINRDEQEDFVEET